MLKRPTPTPLLENRKSDNHYFTPELEEVKSEVQFYEKMVM